MPRPFPSTMPACPALPHLQIELVKDGKPYVMFGDGTLAACKPISEQDLAAFIADCVQQVGAGARGRWGQSGGHNTGPLFACVDRGAPDARALCHHAWSKQTNHPPTHSLIHPPTPPAPTLNPAARRT